MYIMQIVDLVVVDIGYDYDLLPKLTNRRYLLVELLLYPAIDCAIALVTGLVEVCRDPQEP